MNEFGDAARVTSVLLRHNISPDWVPGEHLRSLDRDQESRGRVLRFNKLVEGAKAEVKERFNGKWHSGSAASFIVQFYGEAYLRRAEFTLDAIRKIDPRLALAYKNELRTDRGPSLDDLLIEGRPGHTVQARMLVLEARDRLGIRWSLPTRRTAAEVRTQAAERQRRHRSRKKAQNPAGGPRL